MVAAVTEEAVQKSSLTFTLSVLILSPALSIFLPFSVFMVKESVSLTVLSFLSFPSYFFYFFIFVFGVSL